MTEELQQYVPTIVSYGTKIVGVIAALVGALIVGAWLRALMRRGLDRAGVDLTLSKFVANTVRYAVVTLAVIACLGVFGIETTSFAAVLGAAGLAIGLAFQGSLSNLAAGVMLLVFRPFKVGDVVNAAGVMGSVDEIELFTVRMKTPDNRLLIVPNSAVFGGTIENLTAFDQRRCDVSVGTDYGASLDETRSVLERAVGKVDGVLDDPGYQIYLVDLGDSAVLWQVRVWVRTPDYWGMREKVTHAIKMSLDAAGIGIPFPQQDVHFDAPVVDVLRRSA